MADVRLIDANIIPYCKSGFPKGDGFDNGLDWAFREDIDKLPTVDAAPVVHGRWDDECRCTACGWYGDDIYKRLALSFDYCPNCGAKMDLEVPDGKT
jgi:hypothetical protein